MNYKRTNLLPVKFKLSKHRIKYAFKKDSLYEKHDFFCKISSFLHYKQNFTGVTSKYNSILLPYIAMSYEFGEKFMCYFIMMYYTQVTNFMLSNWVSRLYKQFYKKKPTKHIVLKLMKLYNKFFGVSKEQLRNIVKSKTNNQCNNRLIQNVKNSDCVTLYGSISDTVLKFINTSTDYKQHYCMYKFFFKKSYNHKAVFNSYKCISSNVQLENLFVDPVIKYKFFYNILVCFLIKIKLYNVIINISRLHSAVNFLNIRKEEMFEVFDDCCAPYTSIVENFKSLLVYSLYLKNTPNLTQIISVFFSSIHFKHHRIFFMKWCKLLQYFLDFFTNSSIQFGGFLGFRGKLGVGGSVRKRAYSRFFGKYGFSNLKVHSFRNLNQIWTDTGAVGVSCILV